MSEVWGWEDFFSRVLVFLRQLLLEHASQNQLHYYLERLEIIISGVQRIRGVLLSAQSNDPEEINILEHYRMSTGELLSNLGQVYSEVDNTLDTCLSRPTMAYQCGRVESGQRGRPKFCVTADQLSYLASLSFTWTHIAKMLGISRMTLYRRRVEFGMAAHEGQVIRDSQLWRLVREMRSEFPEMGEVLVLGRLRSLGYHVLRDRVRRAIRATDPINTALRATAAPLSRRVYSVPGPNSLWHIGKLNVAKPYENPDKCNSAWVEMG